MLVQIYVLFGICDHYLCFSFSRDLKIYRFQFYLLLYKPELNKQPINFLKGWIFKNSYHLNSRYIVAEHRCSQVEIWRPGPNMGNFYIFPEHFVLKISIFSTIFRKTFLTTSVVKAIYRL